MAILTESLNESPRFAIVCEHPDGPRFASPFNDGSWVWGTRLEADGSLRALLTNNNNDHLDSIFGPDAKRRLFVALVECNRHNEIHKYIHLFKD